jgi:hypothetical protein
MQKNGGDLTFMALQQDVVDSPVRWALWGVGLIMTIIMTVWLGKLADRILHSKLNDTGSPESGENRAS